jgi:glucose-6-phosphate isomerase
MSVIRPKPPEDPLRYDPAAACANGTISREAVAALADRLEAVRSEVLGDADGGRAADRVAPAVAFLGLPDRLLADYGTTRPQSELFAILREARRVRETVDRVVVIGGTGIMGARVIVAACCHPFHNELGRGERGGRPRLSFVADDLDNDVAQGLLDLVAPHGRPRGDDLLDRWALVVVNEGGSAETATVFRAALRDAVGGDERLLADRVVSITRATGLGAAAVVRGGCPEAFAIPAGVRGGFAVFTAVGLLPASIAGCDVVRLLEGAAAMNRRFREAPVADNPVLQFAAVSRVATAWSGAPVRGLATRSRQLLPVSSWYERLRSARAGTAGVGAGPGTVLTSLVVGECRRDRLVLPSPEPAAAGQGGAGVATAEIHLPRLDEHAVGQLLQMLMLATAIEDRLGDP